MVQWLRVLAALTENPGFILSTHVTAHNHMNLQLQETSHLLDSMGTKHTCGACTHNDYWIGHLHIHEVSPSLMCICNKTELNINGLYNFSK